MPAPYGDAPEPGLNKPDVRGVVDPRANLERVALTVHPPSQDLSWALARHWSVGWDLPAPFETRVLPHPAAHLVFEDGEATVEAPSREEFSRKLEGRGRVVAVRFRPAGLRPWLGRPVAEIVGRRMPAVEVFGPEVEALAERLRTVEGAEESSGPIEAFLRARVSDPLPATEWVNAVVDLLMARPGGWRVAELAERLGVGARQLQRLFADHVGVGPKWVINRSRLHEATAAADGDEPPDWARLAADLGYADQAHLIRDFSANVGTTPGRYGRGSGATTAADGPAGSGSPRRQ